MRALFCINMTRKVVIMKKENKKEIGKGIEVLLRELREKNNWTYLEVVEKLNTMELTEKEVKKWEYGLKYPDLDMIYKLSELYRVPSEEFVQAKNNSYEKGYASINVYTIKWICYILNVSIYTGMVLTAIFYILALVFAFLFFLTMANNFKA